MAEHTQKQKPHYYLETQHLSLRPYAKKHVKEYHSWFQNDSELLYLTGSESLTYQEELQNHKSWLTDPTKYTFLIFQKQTLTMIGDVNLFFSEWIEPHQAEINIMIAVKEARGKGYAKEVMEMIEYFVGSVYGKTEIIAKIKDDNKASIKFFEKIGYQFINHSEKHGEVEYRKDLKKEEKCKDVAFMEGKFGLRAEENAQSLFQL